MVRLLPVGERGIPRLCLHQLIGDWERTKGAFGELKLGEFATGMKHPWIIAVIRDSEKKTCREGAKGRRNAKRKLSEQRLSNYLIARTGGTPVSQESF
jgi:hypothetical protein